MNSTNQEQTLRDHFVAIESVRKSKILEIQNLLSERRIETIRLESLEKKWFELSKFDISAWMHEEKIQAANEEISKSDDLYRKKNERSDAAHAIHVASFDKYAWAGFWFMLGAVAFLS